MLLRIVIVYIAPAIPLFGWYARWALLSIKANSFSSNSGSFWERKSNKQGFALMSFPLPQELTGGIRPIWVKNSQNVGHSRRPRLEEIFIDKAIYVKNLFFFS